MDVKYRRIFLIGVIFAISFSSLADSSVPPENELLTPPSSVGVWYYEIGGANTLILPAYNKSRFKFKVGIGTNGNLTCSDLDPNISIDNIVNGVKKGWASLQRNMVNSVSGVVSSLPGLALHYIDPGVYDMVQSALLAAEDQFQIEVASCQSITNDLMTAKPNYEWVKASGYEKYAKFFTGDDPDAAKADAGEVVNDMEKNAGKDGVQWMCGEMRGGEGQKAIVMSETVRAGYNRLIGRGECETKAPVKDRGNPMFVKYWPSPKDAEKWLADMFGEIKIFTDPQKPPRSAKPGAGLMMKIEETTETIATDLYALVDEFRRDGYEPSLRDLQRVSAPGTLVTKQVIDALSKSGDSNLYIKRLATDMAAQREMLKALEMRRVLYSASMVNEISQAKPAKEIVVLWMKRISEEVRLVKEEMEIRRFLNQNTIPSILSSDFEQTMRALR